MLRHFLRVRHAALGVEGNHAWLGVILSEMLLDVKVTITDSRGRPEGIVDAAVAETQRRVEDFEAIQIGVPSTPPFVVNGSLDHGLEAGLHRQFDFLHVHVCTGGLRPP